MPIEPQNFWNFSLTLYDQEDVANACLDLQNLYQFDVNLILFCFWYGQHHGAIEQQLFEEVFQFSTDWRHNVVQPLRSARSWLKTCDENNSEQDALRESIKADELNSERYQQDRMAELVLLSPSTERAQRDSTSISKNVDRLLQAMGQEKTTEIEAKIAVIANGL